MNGGLLCTACKCDLRDDRAVQERLARFGYHTVQYEEGLAVARRIRASRYLGTRTRTPVLPMDAELSVGFIPLRM